MHMRDTLDTDFLKFIVRSTEKDEGIIPCYIKVRTVNNLDEVIWAYIHCEEGIFYVKWAAKFLSLCFFFNNNFDIILETEKYKYIEFCEPEYLEWKMRAGFKKYRADILYYSNAFGITT
jgi:hypothetical protein